MDSKQFKIKMIEIDIDNKALAEKLGVNLITIQRIIASDRIPLVYQWALKGLEFEQNKKEL